MSARRTYIDLFAGCGGLSLGLYNAGWKGLFAIEKSPDAFETLKFNLIQKKAHFDWPKWLEKKEHDINQILVTKKQELSLLRGTVDLVAGGPPCQGFSIAGRRKENDTRNSLVNSYIDFIRLVQPKLIFFENVKGFTVRFKNGDKKNVAYSNFIIEELESLGYVVKGQLIDFSQYGIPQKRIRFILVGIRKNILANKPKLTKETFFEQIKCNKEAFLASKKLTTTPTLKDAISDLLQSNGEVKSEHPKFKEGVYGRETSTYQAYARRNVGKNKKVDSHRFVNHTSVVKNRFKIGIKEQLSNKEYKTRFNLKKSSTKILKPNKPTPTITTLPDDYIHYSEPRILTVREYARLQSFPDTFQFKGKYTTGGKRRIEEVPRYSQIGNAIPPLFSEQVGLILISMLNE